MLLVIKNNQHANMKHFKILLELEVVFQVILIMIFLLTKVKHCLLYEIEVCKSISDGF